MFSNTIEFLAPKVVLEDKVAHPLPIKKLIPDWYKKLSADKDTVKNCMPFLDTLTTGYALPLTSDLIVKFNHIETDDTIVRCPHEASVRFAVENNLNVGYVEYFYAYSRSGGGTYYINIKLVDEAYVNNTYARPRFYLTNSSSYNTGTNRQTTNQTANSTNTNILRVSMSNQANAYGTFQFAVEPFHWHQ